MRITLFQPDIPQNTGALFRLSTCLGVALDIIEPMGFILDDSRLKRAGMDYMRSAEVTRHRSWEDFLQNKGEGRLVLLSTKGGQSCYDFAFHPLDHLVLGRESKGAPEDVHDVADAVIRIPMVAGVRSLNMAMAAAIAVSEALRQTNGLPR